MRRKRRLPISRPSLSFLAASLCFPETPLRRAPSADRKLNLPDAPTILLVAEIVVFSRKSKLFARRLRCRAWMLWKSGAKLRYADLKLAAAFHPSRSIAGAVVKVRSGTERTVPAAALNAPCRLSKRPSAGRTGTGATADPGRSRIQTEPLGPTPKLLFATVPLGACPLSHCLRATPLAA